MEIQYTSLALVPEFGRLDFLEWKQKRAIMNYGVCRGKISGQYDFVVEKC